MKLKTTLLAEIQNIDWFSNVGNTSSKLQDVIQVANWDECELHFLSNKWEDTTLEARNEITSFLSVNNINAYDDWNDLTKLGQNFLRLHVIPKIEELEIPINNMNVFLSCVRWDLLGVLMEAAYEKYKKPSFFTELLGIYQQGHFPCGWKGDWPNGKLIIY